MIHSTHTRSSGFSGKVLVAAGLYNALFGILAVFWPNLPFELSGMQIPTYPILWQGIGMIVGVYGIGYLLASQDPNRHWPIVLVGFLGKVFGPIGFVFYAAQGVIPWSAGLVIIFNDLIWWVPFFAILREAYLDFQNEQMDLMLSPKPEKMMMVFEDQHGDSLLDISMRKPAMVLFLRHFGCTFCRESLQDLSKIKGDIQEKGLNLVIVHMSDEETAENYLSKHGLESVSHISDPECTLYKSFGLKRGSLKQLFGWREWLRGFHAGLLKKNWVGTQQGDGFRMPGIFIVENGTLKARFLHQRASQRPDYMELVNCVLNKEEDISTSSFYQDAESTRRVADLGIRS